MPGEIGEEPLPRRPDAIPEQVTTFTGTIRGIYFQEKRASIQANTTASSAWSISTR